MLNKLLVLAIALGLAACASSPEQPSNEAAAMAAEDAETVAAADDAEMMAANEATEDAGDEIICRREYVTGSRFTKKICRRASDIEAAATEAQNALSQIRSNQSGSFNDMQGMRN